LDRYTRAASREKTGPAGPRRFPWTARRAQTSRSASRSSAFRKTLAFVGTSAAARRCPRVFSAPPPSCRRGGAGTAAGRAPKEIAPPPWPGDGTGRTEPGPLRTVPGAMNFELTEDQTRIRDAVREFAESEIAPGVVERETHELFPSEVIEKLGAMGILGMMVPERYGGAGADALSYVLAVEELSRVCASTAVIVSVNNSVFCYPVWKYGTEEQKTTVLREVATGEALGAYALTEPQSGSDAANQKTRAVRRGNEYVLDGAKAWITNAGVAKWYLVMAMTDASAGTRGITGFLVSADDP